MIAAFLWKDVAEMPKFKSSAPHGGVVDVTLFFWGGGGGTTYFICGKTSSSRVSESDGLFMCFGCLINI